MSEIISSSLVDIDCAKVNITEKQYDTKPTKNEAVAFATQVVVRPLNKPNDNSAVLEAVEHLFLRQGRCKPTYRSLYDYLGNKRSKHGGFTLLLFSFREPEFSNVVSTGVVRTLSPHRDVTDTDVVFGGIDPHVLGDNGSVEHRNPRLIPLRHQIGWPYFDSHFGLARRSAFSPSSNIKADTNNLPEKALDLVVRAAFLALSVNQIDSGNSLDWGRRALLSVIANNHLNKIEATASGHRFNGNKAKRSGWVVEVFIDDEVVTLKANTIWRAIKKSLVIHN